MNKAEGAGICADFCADKLPLWQLFGWAEHFGTGVRKVDLRKPADLESLCIAAHLQWHHSAKSAHRTVYDELSAGLDPSPEYGGYGI